MQCRNAFTMVELIFVIIILSVLAVVALPRFMSISEESKRTLCNSAIATMNRTVGLNFWSKSLSDGNKGNILTYVTIEGMNTNLPDYNETECGAIIGLVPGAMAIGDGIYGSPRLISDGNMTHAPRWEWIKK